MKFKVDKKKFFIILADSGKLEKNVIKDACSSRQVIGKIRNGEPLRADTVGKIAKALGCSAKDLLED